MLHEGLEHHAEGCHVCLEGQSGRAAFRGAACLTQACCRVTVARPRLRALYLNMTGLLHVFLPQMRYFR